MDRKTIYVQMTIMAEVEDVNRQIHKSCACRLSLSGCIIIPFASTKTHKKDSRIFRSSRRPTGSLQTGGSFWLLTQRKLVRPQGTSWSRHGESGFFPCFLPGRRSWNPSWLFLYIPRKWIVSENGGFSPQIIHFDMVFHYKSSILGYPYFEKHPYLKRYFMLFQFHAWQMLRFVQIESLRIHWYGRLRRQKDRQASGAGKQAGRQIGT